MNKEELLKLVKEGDADRLDAEKKRLEILALRRPTVLRSNFWLAAIPVILAGYGAYQVSQSEVFDIVRARLELRSENLDLKNNRLLEQIDSTKKKFAEDKKVLEQRAAELEADFSKKLNNLNEEFSARKLEISKEEHRLKKETQSLKNEKVALLKEMADLRTEFENQREFGQIESNFQELRKCLDTKRFACDAYHDAAVSLRKMLSDHGTERQKNFFEEELKTTEHELFKTLLVAIKFDAKNILADGDQLLSRVINSPDDIREKSWRIFGSVPWHRTERSWDYAFEVLERAFLAVKSNGLDERIIRSISFPFGAAHESLPASGFNDPELLVFSINSLREIAKDPENQDYKKTRAVTLLLTIKPEIFMVEIATMIQNDQLSDKLLSEVGNLLVSAKGRVKKSFEKYNFPSTIKADWSSWLDLNDSLIKTWADPLPASTLARIMDKSI